MRNGTGWLPLPSTSKGLLICSSICASVRATSSSSSSLDQGGNNPVSDGGPFASDDPCRSGASASGASPTKGIPAPPPQCKRRQMIPARRIFHQAAACKVRGDRKMIFSGAQLEAVRLRVRASPSTEFSSSRRKAGTMTAAGDCAQSAATGPFLRQRPPLPPSAVLAFAARCFGRAVEFDHGAAPSLLPILASHAPSSLRCSCPEQSERSVQWGGNQSMVVLDKSRPEGKF